jgi:acetylornithine deacetylase
MACRVTRGLTMEADAAVLLRRLVALPSIAGADNRAVIAEIAERLDDAGATVTMFPGTRPGTQLLHAVLGPADAPGGLLLAAHGDVVDVEGQPWSSDPFTLRIEDGRLYGRGTTDMKGFIAATLAATTRARPASLTAPLHVAISHDEELGCAGVGPLLDVLDSDAVAAPLTGVVVGEPTELRVVDRHKGKAAFDITVHGRAAHSATPALGVNAVRGAAHLIVGFEELERELTQELTDDAFSTPHATVGVGPISGGVALNIVPDRCALKLEIRVLPGQSLDAIERRVGEVASRVGRALAARAPHAGVEVARAARYPPLVPEPATAAFARRVAQVAAQGVGGAVDFGTEAGLYQQRLGVPVVVCGPGSMAQGHTPDEFIDAGQLAAGQAFVTGLIRGLSPS